MTELATKLQKETAAVRLAKTSFGTHRALKKDQIRKAAEVFGADGSVVRARKKLLDTKCEEYRAVTSTITSAVQYWKLATVPYPERGIRLIRRSKVKEFTEKMGEFAALLETRVKALDVVYQSLISDSKEKLGDLFDAKEYPSSMEGLFSIEYDFPSTQVPNYLKEINPELWQEECKKLEARFVEAGSLMQQAFATEFSDLVNTLTDKLTQPDEEGKRKVLRDTAVTKFQEFFERFEALKVGDDKQLEELIQKAKSILAGVDPEKLRRDVLAKDEMKNLFAPVKEAADNLVTARGRLFDIEND